jgi:hypothetical protein
MPSPKRLCVRVILDCPKHLTAPRCRKVHRSEEHHVLPGCMVSLLRHLLSIGPIADLVRFVASTYLRLSALKSSFLRAFAEAYFLPRRSRVLSFSIFKLIDSIMRGVGRRPTPSAG